MTNIEQKALELVNEMREECGLLKQYNDNIIGSISFPALCRAIEQHEAFRQEVSDALEKRGFYIDDRDLGRFIIAKPDPLVEIADEMKETYCPTNVAWARNIHQALAKRGLEIREKGK